MLESEEGDKGIAKKFQLSSEKKQQLQRNLTFNRYHLLAHNLKAFHIKANDTRQFNPEVLFSIRYTMQSKYPLIYYYKYKKNFMRIIAIISEM